MHFGLTKPFPSINHCRTGAVFDDSKIKTEIFKILCRGPQQIFLKKYCILKIWLNTSRAMVEKMTRFIVIATFIMKSGRNAIFLKSLLKKYSTESYSDSESGKYCVHFIIEENLDLISFHKRLTNVLFSLSLSSFCIESLGNLLLTTCQIK